MAPDWARMALAAAVLLLSDLPKTAKSEKTFKVAMLQMASQPIMDDGANTGDRRPRKPGSLRAAL
ncbi:MAG: hypothetical protein U0936_11515 [Planctomycetaceae bacterium]